MGERSTYASRFANEAGGGICRVLYHLRPYPAIPKELRNRALAGYCIAIFADP